MSFNIKTAAGRYVIASNSSLLVSGKDCQLYSESEMMIGYWTDNKPLYRIVIHDNTYRTGSGVIWNYADRNIDTLVNYHITADGWDAQYHNLYVADAYTSQSTRCSSVCNLADKQIEILIGSVKIDSLTLVVEYTKTTDNPVSDLYTYSYNEKFTGETWVDGRPVYRIVASTLPEDADITLRDTEIDSETHIFEYVKVAG